MPGVNLDNQRIAEVQPTVGTERRAELHRPDYTGLLSSVVEGVGKVKTALNDRAEQKAALAIVDESLTQQEGKTSFQADKPVDLGDAAASTVEADTGIALDAGDKSALSSAAAVGTRLNDAQTAQPNGERRFNLIRTKELRKLIADRPHLAKEFRSLIYGDNNFITSLMDDTEKASAAEAKARHETIAKARDVAYQAGHTEVIDYDDEKFVSWYQQSGYAADLKTLSDTKKEADYYKSLYEKGTSINAEDTRRMVLAGKPGLMRTTMAQLDSIISNPTLDPASKQRAIEAVKLNRRMEIQAQMPWLSANDINTQFKDVLEDVPSTYLLLASEGPEKQAAEQRLAIVKSNIELNLEKQYGKSTVEFVSRVVQNIQASGVLANYNTVRDSKPMQDFLGALASGVNGDNPPPPRLSKRTEREVAEETEQSNAFVQPMLGGFDKLDPDSRRATAAMVVSAINHPDNRRTDAGMDRLMVLMASPQFKALADSPEWKDTVDNSADRAIGVYLRNLDQAVGTTLGPLEGKVAIKLDDQGVLTFVPATGMQSKDRDALARLQNRLRSAIFANANLHGQTPAEATRDFYDTYLSK